MSKSPGVEDRHIAQLRTLMQQIADNVAAIRGVAERTAATAPSSPYLTAPEAARYLRFASVRALYLALKADDIPHRRRGSKTLLFHRGDLDRWLAGADARDLRREARRATTSAPNLVKGGAE